MKKKYTLLIAIMAVMLMVNCAAEEAVANTDIEITGSWVATSNEEIISNSEWKTTGQYGSTYTVTKYDSANNIVIIQNLSTASSSPSKFNRIKYTDVSSNVFYYCWEVFGKDTAAEAESDTTSYSFDAADPTKKSCGIGSWTKLTRKS